VSWHIGSTPVVVRRLGVVEDVAQLLEVSGAQIVGDVVHRLGGEAADRLGLDLEERALGCLERGDTVGGDEPVLGVVGAQREQLGVLERGDLSHAPSLRPPTRPYEAPFS
jgi:hypothetical protein